MKAGTKRFLENFEKCNYTEQDNAMIEYLENMAIEPKEVGVSVEQERLIQQYLAKRGITPDRVKIRSGRVMDCYVGDAAVLIIADLPSHNGKFYTIVDRDFYEKNLKNDKGSISFNIRHQRSYKVIFHQDGGMPLHKKMLSTELKDVVVDHRFHSPLINTFEALRLCSSGQNRWNCKFYFSSAKKNLPKEIQEEIARGKFTEKEIYTSLVDYAAKEHGEFAYNPLEDFTYTWYAYMIYKLTGDITEAELRDYNRDFIYRYFPDIARYYASILES